MGACEEHQKHMCTHAHEAKVIPFPSILFPLEADKANNNTFLCTYSYVR